ncbi:hypothetical protein D3C78_1657930 [compost metagenome]
MEESEIEIRQCGGSSGKVWAVAPQLLMGFGKLIRRDSGKRGNIQGKAIAGNNFRQLAGAVRPTTA